MCIGRRLAEQNIYLVLIKILQHYRIEYVGDKSKFFFIKRKNINLIQFKDYFVKFSFLVNPKCGFTVVPDKSVNLKFFKRN
jgi:hypothetical protein